MKTAKLSKACIKEMVEAKNPGPSPKSYLAQVSQIKDKGTPDKPQKVMLLSDGTYSIRSIYAGPVPIKEFDVVAVKDFYAAQMKETHFVVVKALSVIFTDLTGTIGTPLEFGRGENPPEKEYTIPQTATLVAKDFFEGESMATENDEVEKEILVAVQSGKLQGEPRKVEEKKVTPKQMANAIKDMPGVRPVKSLGAYSSDWVIKVRLTSKGKPKTFKKRDGGSSSLMPLEFVDEDGTQITATIFGRGVEKFDPVLEEGKCYFVSKGTVKFATKKYTTIANDHTITLDETSEIKLAADDSSIKHKVFNFTPISRLKEVENGTLVDIIGIVNEVGPVTKITKEGQEIAKRTITLYDESKDLINMTLWRDLAEYPLVEKQIIGIKTARVAEFNRAKQLNSVGDTAIVKSPEDPRLPKLKSLVEQNVVPVKASAPKSKESLSLIAEIANPSEDTLANAKNKYYNISGEIVSVSYDKGFFYVACSGCKKKVQGEKCQNCGEDKGTKVTYTFSVQVSDGTASVWVHIFGDEGEKLLGKPAEEVKALKELPEPAHKEVFDSIKGRVFFSICCDPIDKKTTDAFIFGKIA